MNAFKKHTAAGIVFVLIAGTFSHFLYEWTNRNFIIGLFTPVNESTWEHMKLIFFPMLLYFYFIIPGHQKSCPCIAPAAAFGVLTGTLLIPIIFYTYTGILGYHIFLLDFGTFVLSVLIAFSCFYRLSISCKIQKYRYLLYGLTFLFLAFFLLFTCAPPSLRLFQPPTIVPPFG